MYDFVQGRCLVIESPKRLCGSGVTPNTGWEADMNTMGNNTLGHRRVALTRRFTTNSSFQTDHSNRSERNKETTGPLLRLDFCMNKATPSIIRFPSLKELRSIRLS